MENMNDLVSIVMAIHNVDDYIVTALNSVKNQTYSNFEVIIVDDNSTDNTVSFIYNKFCKVDKRFKLFANITDKNVPYIEAHNKSLEYAKGKYLIRFDGDDIMMPNHIETIVTFMDNHPEIDACCTCVNRKLDNKNGEFIDYATSAERPLEWIERENEALDIAEIEKFNKCPAAEFNKNQIHIFNQSSCIRKSWYDEYKPQFNFYKVADTIFWWTVFGLGAKFYKIPEVTLLYRIHKESISRTDRFYEYLNKEYDLQIYAALCKSKAFGFYDKDMIIDDTTAGQLSEYYKEVAERFNIEKQKHLQNGE